MAALRTSSYRTLLVVVLLAVHAVLLFDASRRNFLTCNEVGHIPAGLAHLQTGNFSMYRVNPPLARMLAAWPLLWVEPIEDYHRLDNRPGARPEWSVGEDFLAANADRFFRLVCLARLAGIAWSLVGGWLVYRWTCDLYGTAGGCLSLALWCFCPLILAFGPLVVPDVPASVACLAASYSFWCYLRKPSWPSAGLTGLLLGIAQLTKFTNLILYAVWPILWLVERYGRGSPSQKATPARTQIAQGTLIILLGIFLMNLGYGFQGSGRALRDFGFLSSAFTGEPAQSTTREPGQTGNRFRDHWIGNLIVPVPQEYLQGIDAQLHDLEAGRPSYLCGEWSFSGWWYYYLYGLAVKLPLGFLALTVWALLLSVFRNPASAGWIDELTLWLPAVAIIALVSSRTDFDHHLRYVLPAVPFLLIGTGKLAYFFRRDYWKTGLGVMLLLVWSAGSVLAVHPNYLAYFNEAAGGPDRGDDHLLSSNLDWGQDLFRLKDWLDAHPDARPLGLAYGNFVDPRLIGIDYALPAFGPAPDSTARPDENRDLGPRPGYYAVSANLVRGMCLIVPDGNGGWSYVPPHAYEYFHRFHPVAKAGYSIFIYHITRDEANGVRSELGLPELIAESETNPLD